MFHVSCSATIIVLDQGSQGVTLPNAINVGNARMTNMTKGHLLTPMTTSMAGSVTPTGTYSLTPSSTPSTPGGSSSGIGSTQHTPGGSNSSSNTNNGSPNKFECDICKLKFVSNYNLKRHSRTHDATRPRWQCSYCDKSFTRRDSLPKHINFVHKNEAAMVKDEEVSLEASTAASVHQESPGGHA